MEQFTSTGMCHKRYSWNYYVWANRPFQPLQPPMAPLSQQSPPPQPYPSFGYSVGYNGHPSGSIHGYHQEHHPPPPYLPAAPSSAGRQGESRSPLITRLFPPHSASLSEQPQLTSPLLNIVSQPTYSLPEVPPIPSSHPSSISSQASSLITEPVLCQSDSIHSPDNEHQARVISSCPRPQCWDHDCNGREFSTSSNLLRHQREKSGKFDKAECPICGAFFTRTTARNSHVALGRCKGTGRESSTE